MLADSKYFSELDLSEAYNQMNISEELSHLMTFTCSFGKLSMQVMPYRAIFASDMFHSRISDEFCKFLDLFLLIYHRQPYCSCYHYGGTLGCLEEGALSLQEGQSPLEKEQVCVHG